MKETEMLMEKIQDADYVLIGIGEEFNETFEHIGEHADLMKILDFIQTDEERKWMVPYLEKAYLETQPSDKKIDALRKLFEQVKDKNYFVVTTCIDGNVYKAGFEPEKVVEPCGGYRFLQCEGKCTLKLQDADGVFKELMTQLSQGNFDVKQPVCEACGKPLVFNNILCESYAEEGYLPQWEVYTKWLQKTLNRKLCVIELGVGLNLPGVIRWPFEKIGFLNQKASFFRVHETIPQLTDDLKDKGVSVKCNAVEFLLEEL